MSAMLLREGESLVSTPLRPHQSHILLRLWCHSASRLREWYFATFQGINLSGEKANKVNQRARSADDIGRLASWEALSAVLKSSGAKLLTQFRDSSTELSLVIDLLRCFDVNASFSGDKTFKSFKAVLKSTTDLFESLPDRDILVKLAELFSSWYALDGTASSSTSDTIKSLLQSLWQSITGNYEVLKNAATGVVGGSSSKSNKRKSSSRNGSQEDMKDTAYNLNVSLFKYMALWRAMDCRQVTDMKEEQIFSILTDLCVQAVSVAESQAHVMSKNADFESDLAATCTAAVTVMRTIVYWLTRSVYLIAPKVHQEMVIASSEVAATDDAVTSKTDQLVNLRESLLSILCSWMTTDIDSDAGVRVNQFHRVLQRSAFQIVGDIRMLFQARSAGCKVVGGLAYTPTQDILGALRKVFELEGQRLRNNIHEVEEEDEAEADRLATILVKSLLTPLSSSLLHDIDNLNRRQAAAVLCYSLEPQKIIFDNVRATMKTLKDRDVVKYLEVQMVALKSAFLEHVVTHLRSKIQAESGSAENGFDFDECEKQVETGLETITTLAKKFSTSLGVGHVKEPTLLEALLRFFELAIDLSFSEEENVGFVSVLEPYIRLVPSEKCSLIKKYLEGKINDKPDISHQLSSNQRVGLPLDMQCLLSFRDKISGSVGSNKRARRGKGAADDEDEEDALEGNIAVVPTAAAATSGASKVLPVDDSTTRRGPSWGPSTTHTSFRLGGSASSQAAPGGVRYRVTKPAMTQSKVLTQPTRSNVIEDSMDEDKDDGGNENENAVVAQDEEEEEEMSPIAHRDSRQHSQRPSILSSINDSAFSHPAMGLMLDDLPDESAFQSLGYRREEEKKSAKEDDEDDGDDEFAQLSKISKRKYAL